MNKNLQNIKRSFGIPKLLKFISLGFSYCRKCGLPWNFCNPKSVMYSVCSGIIAVCDFCWDNLSLEELKDCYTSMYIKQKNSLYNAGYEMDHSLELLLYHVELEYNKTHKK